jgi:pimeloyl-ACP methyl ester carboxylesterase
MRSLRLASKRFAAKVTNPAAASQLIIAHGLLGNALNWATAARHLVEHPSLKDQLRCACAVDMRNHGNSPHSRNHTNAALASDLEAVVLREQQELHRAFADPAACSSHNSILIGHSMGGLAVIGSLLRRANEDRLLPQYADDYDDDPSGQTSPFGPWSADRRRGCSASMRAVNEEFSFAPSQPIAEVLFTNQATAATSSIVSRIPRLGRIAGAVIVDVTPTMRLGEQRSSADNVRETLERMTKVNLKAIHSYDNARDELIRVGMTDKAMRDFVMTNIVLDARDKTQPAQWKCNLPALASDYGSFQSTITTWYGAAAGAEAAGGKSAVVVPHSCSLPVLFVFGGTSPYNEPEHRRRISTFFSNATQVEVAGAGHFVHYEKTKEFADAVAPFIASLTAQP